MKRSKGYIFINMAGNGLLWLLSVGLMAIYLMGPPAWFVRLTGSSGPPDWYMYPALLIGICWGMVGITYWVGKLDNR